MYGTLDRPLFNKCLVDLLGARCARNPTARCVLAYGGNGQDLDTSALGPVLDHIRYEARDAAGLLKRSWKIQQQVADSDPHADMEEVKEASRSPISIHIS